MAKKTNEFLLEYFKRMIFRDMPIEQFVHYCGFVKSDDMAGNMKEWRDTLLEKDSSGNLVKNAAGLYVPKELPDPESGEWELDSAEWEKFFNAFQNAFQAMDANRNKFKYDDKATKFLNKYFGNDGQLFSYTTANIAAENKIDELKTLLTTYADKLKPMLRNYFSDDFSWDDLIDGLNSKKYNKDPKFRQRMTDIAEALAYDTRIPANSVVYSLINRQLDFAAISDGFGGGTINPAKMTHFKLVYSDLLKELYTNTKAFDAFSASDPTKISRLLNEAKGLLDYNSPDSPGYISPQRDDRLTLPQRVSEWWSDTYSNYLEKYVKLSGDRMFFSPFAKAIFKEIDKKGIKPTDGLQKILDSAGDISDALKKKFKKAPGQFDWFVQTMTEMKNTMKSGKAFAKALQNGRSLNLLVQNVIIKAVRENKIDEAKTTLELLSVLRYTYTSSKIMDALNKSDLTIFSDTGLSWNKTEGVRFITAAMDKGIKKALQLFGYTITIAGNVINRAGTKFNGRLNKMADAYNDQMTGEQNKLNNLRDTVRNVYTPMRDQARTDFSTLVAHHGNPNAVQRNVTAYSGARDAAQQVLNNRIDDLAAYVNTNPYATGNVNILIANDIWQKLQNDSSLAIDPHIIGMITDPALQNIVTNIQTAQANYQNASNTLNAEQIKYQELIDARDTLKTYNDLIHTARDEIASWDENHNDKFKELMAYWDICNSGVTHSWIGSKDKQQKKFDQDKNAVLEEYIRNYIIR